MGDWYERKSPAAAYSPMVGAGVAVHAGGELFGPLDPTWEHAVMLLDGDVSLEGEPLDADTLYYIAAGADELRLHSVKGARLMLIGGAPFGETILMWWNFIARTPAELESARDDWGAHRRFEDVKAYRGRRIEAPALVPRARSRSQ